MERTTLLFKIPKRIFDSIVTIHCSPEKKSFHKALTDVINNKREILTLSLTRAVGEQDSFLEKQQKEVLSVFRQSLSQYAALTFKRDEDLEKSLIEKVNTSKQQILSTLKTTNQADSLTDLISGLEELHQIHCAFKKVELYTLRTE